jgi:acyl transferase domain-containing protein
MIKTDIKTAKAIDQEFNFGSIDIGEQLEIDELNEIKPVEESKEEPKEEPEEEKEEPKEEPEEKEESAEEPTEDLIEEVEDSDEEADEEESAEDSEEEADELTTEEVLGDPLKDEKETDEPKGRTYEGFDDEDKQYAKQMSNAAYDHFTKKLQALKADKSSAEETQDLLSHPEAYSLNPEYQQLVTDYDKASQEQSHWKKQLVAIRNGEGWRSVEGYDKNGKIVYGREEYKPTAESEIDVQAALTEAQTMSKSFSQRAYSIQKNHSANYKGSVQMLEEEQRKQFKWLEDKEMGKKIIEIPNFGKTSINKLRKTFLDVIPKVFSNHPMSELATNLWINNQIMAKQQQELTQKVKKQSRNKKDMLRSEPTSKSTKSKDDGGFFTVDSFMEDFM